MSTTTTMTTTTTTRATTPSTKMGIQAITHLDGQGYKLGKDLPSISPHGSLVHPSTPPESTSGSPRLKTEANGSPHPPSTSRSMSTTTWTNKYAPPPRSRDCSPLPRIADMTRLNHMSGPPPLPQMSSPSSSSSPSSPSCTVTRLPSLEEFDLGVQALARYHGPARPHTPPSPLPSLGLGLMGQGPPTTTTTTSSGTTTKMAHHQPAPPPPHPGYHHHYHHHHHQQPIEYWPVHHHHQGHESLLHAITGLDGYPSPPPDGENRHINQKYTTEEGDFIIYAWHDKKFKWQRIKQDFAAMFGRTPERTVQGLQAWYYRMNQRIPLWNQDGWLIFDNDDELEPKYISIKCRERDSQDKPMEPLGLAQRYPERAIHYSWVDNELKRKAQDWA
ncbi:hypothetical protein CP533_0787 [Ophiocordyceps camponoti-saundersi (nom. inval.)]|nr:hypothetical protein CP533_0787 [Ophiocordyceps camponoti-saundersi (nom. inval.)]